MSGEHRGGTGIADAFYSAFHRPFDMEPARRAGKGIAALQLAPMMDTDWRWYDGPCTVAFIDTKHPRERWSLDRGRGNGLLGMAADATALGVPAFVLVVDTHAGAFTFYALNAPAVDALEAMAEWCAANGRRLQPLATRQVGRSMLRTMTVRLAGYWHFEMLVRARVAWRDGDEHDADETDRRIRTLYDHVRLPQRSPSVSLLEPFAYGPAALAQRRLGATPEVEPVAWHVAQLRELWLADGRAHLVAELDALERRATIIEAPTSDELAPVLELRTTDEPRRSRRITAEERAELVALSQQLASVTKLPLANAVAAGLNLASVAKQVEDMSAIGRNLAAAVTPALSLQTSVQASIAPLVRDLSGPRGIGSILRMAGAMPVSVRAAVDDAA